jgi:hypothetical protein
MRVKTAGAFAGVIASFLVCPCFTFAFETPDYSLKAPDGWREQVKIFGMDVVYVGSFTSKVPPVFGVTSQAKLLKTSELAVYLDENLKKDLAVRKFTGYHVISKGKPKQLRVPAYFIDYEYVSDKGPMRDLAILIPGKMKCHFVSLSATKGDFDFYRREIEPALASFKIK